MFIEGGRSRFCKESFFVLPIFSEKRTELNEIKSKKKARVLNVLTISLHFFDGKNINNTNYQVPHERANKN